MASRLLVHRRVVLAEDAFAEIVIWRVKPSVPPSERGYKYRLAYVVAGECVLRYDNEREKGDHRHIGSLEIPYIFSTSNQLLADFDADIARWNHENGRS